MRSSLAQVVAKRLLMGVLVLAVVSALSFVLVSLTPGDAASNLLGGQATDAQVRELRHSLGLDLPIYEQYWQWLSHAVTGDFGVTTRGSDVAHEIGTRLPVTLSLIVGALLVSLVVGTTLGVVSAVRGGAVGRAVDAVALLGFSLPSFWIAAVAISVFAVNLGWLPATGYVPMGQSVVDWLRSLVLPVAALSLSGIAMIAKQTREAMLDVLGSEHIRMAWASGLSGRSVVLRHALKSTGMRVVTVLGILAVSLLGGTVVVEVIFALPGLGSFAVDATLRRDLAAIQAIVVYFTVIVVLVNLAVDVAYTWLNPRVRAQ